MKTSLRTLVPLLLIVSLGMSSCYYDNRDDLYQYVITACDSSAVLYHQQVVTILDAQCTSCHNAGLAEGGVRLDSYSHLLPYVNNGRLLGAIRHEQGYQPMPSASQKLSDCDLSVIEKWVQGGAPNN